MPPVPAQRHRLSPRLLAASGLTAVAVLAVAAAVVYGSPPRTVRLATGPPGSAYAVIGERYKAILAQSRVRLELVPTAGDAENLARLRDPKSGVKAAFVTSGLPEAHDASGIESLGTVAYEPLWLFERAAAPSIQAVGVAGKRLSVDLAGSGTAALVQRLFQHTGLSASGAEVVRLPPDDAAERLLGGDLDVMALVADWDSPVVRRLVADPRVSIPSYRRADALVALNPDLHKLKLPAGTGDFANGRPPEDVTLVAPKASLLVQEELHDAIQYLLLDAATKVHAPPGIFHAAGAFPAAEALEFPLSDEAARYHKSGRPFFQRHLPFWAAVLLERLLFLVVPLVGVVVPVAGWAGSAYRSLMQNRVLALYSELRLVEQDIDAGAAESGRPDVMARLDELERRAGRVRVPVQLAQMLYTLKDHIRAVRARVGGR